MYLIGQKYEISGLIDLAKAKYGTMVEKFWNTPDYSASAELLWEKGDDGKGLRDTVARAAKENIRDMLKRDEFKALVVSHGEFALEVLERLTA